MRMEEYSTGLCTSYCTGTGPQDGLNWIAWVKGSVAASFSLLCFLLVRAAGSCFPLGHWLIIRCFGFVAHHQQAAKPLSVRNFTPPVISNGCKKRRINISNWLLLVLTTIYFFFWHEVWGAFEKLNNLPSPFLRPVSLLFYRFLKSFSWSSPFLGLAGLNFTWTNSRLVQNPTGTATVFGVCGWREGEDELYLSYIGENDLHNPEYGHCSRGIVGRERGKMSFTWAT